MKAIIKNKDSIELIERKKPIITSDNEVLIRVAVVGLCRTDMYAAQGLIKVKESVILGHEFSGIVEEVGKKVTHIKIKDRVSVMPVFKKEVNYTMLGIDADGAFAEYILVPSSSVYPIPENISFQEAAYLEPIAASLAVLKAPINPSQQGLIYGNNRIAELTYRILKIKGFEKVEIFDSQDNTYLKSNKYDFIIETVASEDVLEKIVNAVKFQGIILLKSRSFNSINIPLNKIVAKEIKLLGVFYGNFTEGIELLATGKLQIKDLFANIFSFSEAIDFLLGKKELSETKKIFFKP